MLHDLQDEEASAAESFHANLTRQFQHFLDRSTVYVVSRWLAFLGLVLLYILRVVLVNGWYIVTYGLGIFLLNNFIGFLSPQVDPDSEGPVRGSGRGTRCPIDPRERRSSRRATTRSSARLAGACPNSSASASLTRHRRPHEQGVAARVGTILSDSS